jgi:sulfotransferase family protein
MAPRNNVIDFLIIGAQKSGTTSLFKYLSMHPEIYMPRGKEIAFFSDDDLFFSKGTDWYLKEYFEKASNFGVKGEASTHYMMYESVPRRIYEFAPTVKLIALLRNPIDRAYSHYRMGVRRGVENRSFEDCIAQAIARGNVPDSQISPNRDYVLFGEYGRILRNYLNYFDKSQLKIVFTEDMARQLMPCIQDAYRFLGVNDTFTPSNINKRYHVSGQERIRGLTQWTRNRVKWVRRQKWASRFTGDIDFDAFLFWIETQLNVKPIDDPGPSNKARSLLVSHYASDVALIESLTGVDVPWKEFNRVTMCLKYNNDT